MKKIGIITILKTNNYGAELQAYATQAILNKLGYDAEIIDYLFYKNPGHIITKASKPSFNHGLKKKLSEKLYPIIARLKAQASTESSSNREKRFDKFHTENTRMSPTYRTIDDLYAAKQSYDVYMVGSDQVWNPLCMKGDGVFFCDFACLQDYKLSYASSFSVPSLPLQYQDLYKRYLASYSKLSVREMSGVEVINRLVGINPEIVCDPTLLLTKEEYEIISKESVIDIKEDYILVYALTYAYNPYPQIERVTRKIQEQLGIRVVYLHSNSIEHYHVGQSITFAGPCEFVYLFLNAKYVITSSFHGTAFAVNFGVPFYSIVPETIHDGRIMSLLRIMGLEDRAIRTTQILSDSLDVNMDYHEPFYKLKRYRKDSLDYLAQSLNEVV